MSVAGLSKSQIGRLGERLVAEGGPADENLDLLHQLLLARSGQLDRAEVRVREGLGVVPTSRVKNTETILEKLRRSGGASLKSVQDLAGMRIVGDFDRHGQDQLVERIVALFGDGDREPRKVDRRAKPMYGYRAVHVIVFPEGEPIEIQVRTGWQHEWAEFFEKLADHVGRGIRYGESPAQGESRTGGGVPSQGQMEARIEAIEALVGWAMAVADMIALVEVGEIDMPDDPATERGRRLIGENLEEMRKGLLDLAAADDAVARLRR